jgi:flavodoxin
MKTVVVYSTRSGNTEKVAQEIASELDCQTIKISKDSSSAILELNDFDLVFIGTGIRGGEPREELLSYLERVEFKDSNRHFALFITWCGGGISDKLVFERISQVLQAKNQKLLDNCYKCLGQFSLFRRGHPNASELLSARKWAKELEQTIDKSI